MPLFQASIRLQIHVDIAIVLANSMPLFQASVRGEQKNGWYQLRWSQIKYACLYTINADYRRALKHPGHMVS